MCILDYSSALALLADRRYGALAVALKRALAAPLDAEHVRCLSEAIHACEACVALDNRREELAKATADAERDVSDLDRRLERALRVAHVQPSGRRGGGGLDAPIESYEPPDDAPLLQVFALGVNEVLLQDAPLRTFGGTRAQGLFRVLLLRRRHPVPKDVLMDLFWPDSTPDSARRSLHQAVYTLRRALGRHGSKLVLLANGGYCLSPELGVWFDAEQFEAHSRRGESLIADDDHDLAEEAFAAAESLYQGDLFADSPYDDWLEAERGSLRARHRYLVEWLCDRAEARGDLLTTAALLQKVVREDPLDERAHRRLAMTYASQGQRGLAIRQLGSCQRALSRRLRADLSPESKALLNELS